MKNFEEDPFSENKDRVLRYRIKGKDIEKAQDMCDEMGVLPNSFTRGMGRMVGFLGEIAVNKFIPRSKYVGNKVFKYDIVKGRNKIEVKSKTCTSCPKEHYVASVNGPKKLDPANNVYFFTRVSKDLRYVWIVGWITTKDFFKKSVFKKKNEKDEEGFVYRVSGYHIKIKDLELPYTFIRKD
tara:strand:+ start:889 stop:1434 length:546 start_codon:yes stop_codon:yes gene_type:complete